MHESYFSVSRTVIGVNTLSSRADVVCVCSHLSRARLHTNIDVRTLFKLCTIIPLKMLFCSYPIVDVHGHRINATKNATERSTMTFVFVCDSEYGCVDRSDVSTLIVRRPMMMVTYAHAHSRRFFHRDIDATLLVMSCSLAFAITLNSLLSVTDFISTSCSRLSSWLLCIVCVV